MLPPRLRVTPLEAVVLLHHVVNCDDAENDADRTVMEIAKEIDGYTKTLPRALLESALYCCNMLDEKGKFWHPFGYSFTRFLEGVIPHDLHFDRYYHVMYEKKKPTQAKT